MAFIRFKESEEFIEAVVLPVDNNVVRITADIEPDTSGFELFLRDNDLYPLDNGEYAGYTTLYRAGEGWFELSNDGSVWTELAPEIPEDVELTEEQKADMELRRQLAELNSRIVDLKNQISATDYRVLKTYEYSLIGKDAGYDIEALHEQRQMLRDEINNLEIQMTALTE